MRDAVQVNQMGGNRTGSLWRRSISPPDASEQDEAYGVVRLGDYEVTLPPPSCSGDQKLPLSQREKQVLFLSARGRTGPEIAERLNVTANTVATYKRRILEKLGCRSIAEAVALATLYATGAKVRLGNLAGHA